MKLRVWTLSQILYKNNISRPFAAGLLILAFFFFFFSACGIEDYPFISPIPSGNIEREMNSQATIKNIPDTNSGSNFTHFTIFYRIYISDRNVVTQPAKDELRDINQSLYEHYIKVEPYIDNSSMGSSSIGSLFTSTLNYYSLVLEGRDIENLLSSTIFNQTIVLDFSQTPGSIPALVVGSARYNLRRSNDGGNFNPIPEDRYFINSSELYDSANIGPNVNADVDQGNIPSGSARHTYVCMYIVGVGLDLNTFSPLYSTPAFVGILRLPDPA